ncbi:gastrula zinc finger protein XlCGF7.1 [Anabrus simplex]|uniref:gastrula zinc finger protein XlCGF7.1 n=1 Tax=Anabrus simplex TaxID=316456 RepID=UPI0035A2BF65
MEEPVSVKCEPAWPSDAEEPSNFEHSQLVSEIILLKQETKSELTEPGPAQENAYEASADIKEEMIIEQNQPVTNNTEENKMENITIPTGRPGEELYRHMLTHSGDRPFCSTESYSTSTQRGNLRTHTSIKSEERPFCCDVCGRAFKQRVHLRNHMVVHSRERQYSCNECNNTFTREDSLRTHMFIHSKQWPYSCMECSSTFARKRSLEKHMLTHSQERPHQSIESGNTYKQLSYLENHIVFHFNDGQYICKECNSTIPREHVLGDDMLMHCIMKIENVRLRSRDVPEPTLKFNRDKIVR